VRGQLYELLQVTSGEVKHWKDKPFLSDSLSKIIDLAKSLRGSNPIYIRQ